MNATPIEDFWRGGLPRRGLGRLGRSRQEVERMTIVSLATSCDFITQTSQAMALCRQCFSESLAAQKQPPVASMFLDVT